MITVFYFIAGLVACHLIYAFAIVPFQYWLAGKMGCEYDPRTNQFVEKRRSHEVRDAD